MNIYFWTGITIAVAALVFVVAMVLFEPVKSRRVAKEAEVKTRLTDGERSVIEAYAMGHMESYHDSLEIYRANLGVVDTSRDLHMRYMSEVDNPCPDLMLRSDLRQQLLSRKARPVTPA